MAAGKKRKPLGEEPTLNAVAVREAMLHTPAKIVPPLARGPPIHQGSTACSPRGRVAPGGQVRGRWPRSSGGVRASHISPGHRRAVGLAEAHAGALCDQDVDRLCCHKSKTLASWPGNSRGPLAPWPVVRLVQPKPTQSG